MFKKSKLRVLASAAIAMLTAVSTLYSTPVQVSAESDLVEVQSWDFGYTGTVETFTAPEDDIYRLEVWGAQGGGLSETDLAWLNEWFVDLDTVAHSDWYRGGLGGYTTIDVQLKAGDELYICVGGFGYSHGGYNGGGVTPRDYPDGCTPIGSWNGGGATHIATGVNHGKLQFYKDATDCIVVVGGGGGAAGLDWVSADRADNVSWYSDHSGGNGGGINNGYIGHGENAGWGGSAQYAPEFGTICKGMDGGLLTAINNVTSPNKNIPGAFWSDAGCWFGIEYCGGGGGGMYGGSKGGSGQSNGGAGGGTSYYMTSSNKYITLASGGSETPGVNTGDGRAKITQLSRGNRVIYDPNGGTGEHSESKVPFGSNPYTLWDGSGFTHPTDVLLGWSTDPTASTPDYLPGEAVTGLIGDTGSITLYAIWSKDWYIEYHNTNGSTGYIPKQTVAYNTLATLSNGSPLKLEHSELLGWTTDPYTKRELTAKAQYALSQQVMNLAPAGQTLHLYAVWRPWYYNVTYHNNIPGQPDETTDRNGVKYVYDTEYTPMTWSEASSIPGFTRDGYYIESWSTDPSGRGKNYQCVNPMSTNGDPTFENLAEDKGTANLYAVWKGNPYRIIIHDNYRNCTCDDEVYNIRVGEDFILPTSTNRHGSNAKLLGYSLTPDYTSDPAYKVQESVRDLTTTAGVEIHLYRIWDELPTVTSPKTIMFDRDVARAAGIELNDDGSVRQSDLEIYLLSRATAQDFEWTTRYGGNIPPGTRNGYTFKIASIDPVSMRDNLDHTCDYLITYIVTDDRGNVATSVTELFFGKPGSNSDGWISILFDTK